jgi:esterase/lipase
VYIPKDEKPYCSVFSIPSKESSNFIPCLYLPFSSGSSKLLIYFHGNAEDIGLSYEMLDHLRSSLKINVLAVEYPGYGIYRDINGCTAEKISEDSETVMKYILRETDLKERDILIFGRSMGSGPATFLSSNFTPGALILMSPYTSIKNVVKGKAGFLSAFISERFDNLKLMPKVTCPTFIVHG